VALSVALPLYLVKFAKFNYTDSNVRKRLFEAGLTNGFVASFQYLFFRGTHPTGRVFIHLLRCKITIFQRNKQEKGLKSAKMQFFKPFC